MTLLSLPTELIELVTEHLSVESFRCFRLACSPLNEQSYRRFKERFYRRRTLLWSSDSLRQFVNVTSHDLGNNIQDLVVDATPRFSILLWKVQKSIVEASAQQDLDKLKCLKFEYDEILADAEKAARYWNETRQDYKMLSSVFEKMHKLESITFAYDGMDNKHFLFGRQYCENSQNEMSRPFVTTLAALATSNLIVRSITIDQERYYGSVSIGRLETISPLLARSCQLFEKLEVLNLSLRDWRRPDEGFEMPVRRAPFLVRLLSKLRNIRQLDLSCHSCLEEDILTDMAEHCSFPRMESCKLDLFRICSITTLFRFLEPAKDSLRCLGLSQVVLKDETVEWEQVLRNIALDLALERAEFKHLFTRMGARIGFNGTLQSSLVVEGPDLKEALTERAERLVSGNWGQAWHMSATAYPFIGLEM